MKIASLSVLLLPLNGAAIEGLESASATDIFRAIHIDTVAREGDGALTPDDWEWYRDDTFDIITKWNGKMIASFTKYLNNTVLPGKIKYESEYTGCLKKMHTKLFKCNVK